MRNWLAKIGVCSATFVCVSSPLWANVVGTDLQNFNATTSGIDYVTVNSSEPLSVGIFHLGLLTNYAVNSLPYFEGEGETQSRVRPNDSLLVTDFSAGVGLFPNFEVGLVVSRLLRQKVDETEYRHGAYENPGWTNYRLSAKYGIWRNHFLGFATVFNATYNLIEDNPYLGDKQSPIYNWEGVIDAKFHRFTVALNGGYRWRNAGKKVSPDIEVSPTRDQLIGSVAGSYLLPGWDTKVIAEIFGSRPTNQKGSDTSNRQASSLEGLVGLKYDWSTEWAFHVGGGTELISGVASPDWRAYAGVNYALGPKFSFGSRDNRTGEAKKDGDGSAGGGGKASGFGVWSLVESRPGSYELYSTNFEFDSDILAEGYEKGIDSLAKILKSFVYKRAVIEGHTDSVGSEAYNLDLSTRRAKSVRRALIKRHPEMDKSYNQAQGFGESQPVASNANYQGRARNRRVEVRLFFE